MKKLQKLGSFIRGIALGAAVFASINAAKAVPFASCITNTSSQISFYLNEAGGSVTVTYEDGSTNTSYNGVTTGTNLPAGFQAGFSLTGHTSYSISVAKNGSGAPSLISTHATTNPRGVDANKVATSSYFGHVYFVDGGIGVNHLNSDLSLVAADTTSGLSWSTLDSGNGTGHTPDWATVAPDGTVLITGSSSNGTAIWQMPGDLSTSQLFLGPIGSWNGTSINAAHGILASRCILTGSIANGNAVLYTIDGNLNSQLGTPGGVQVYHINSGPLPWTNAPDYAGVQITDNLTYNALGGNGYPGFTMGPNGFIYGSTYRGAPGSANFVTIMDSTGSNVLWTSEAFFYPSSPTSGTPPTGDWFDQPRPDGGAYPGGLTGTSAVSPDGNYLLTASIDNYFIIAPLTNGIPNVSAIFTVAPTSYTGNGRGVAWDAADNILLSSSGLGLCQQWSLGITGTAVTTGNAAGTTGFTFTQPSTSVTVVATQPFASQNGVNGTPGVPIPGQFTITRTNAANNYGNAQTVNYVMSGTATTAGGVYTINAPATTNSVVIPAGQQSVVVTITPTTNNVPRTTTTAIMNLAGGAGYSVTAPFADTVFIQNTSSQQLSLAATAPSMYRAYASDFASFTITRLGDTNAPMYSVGGYTFGGTGIEGTDYTAPTSTSFSPGDTNHIVTISPLVGGNPPVHTANPTYVGNLTAVITLPVSPNYAVLPASNSVTLTSIDPGNPTATVLFSDPLDSTTATADTNWLVTYANNNMFNFPTNGNYEVNFGWDMTTDPDGFHGTVSAAPSGATTALRLTVNKGGGNPLLLGTGGADGGVNVYPVDPVSHLPLVFSNSFAVRFNMCLVKGADGGFSTEGALFGLDHSGLNTNWFTADGIVSSPVSANNTPGFNWSSDGYWMWVDSDPGGTTDGDFVGFQGLNPAAPGGDTGWAFIPGGAFGALFDTGFTGAFKTNNAGNSTPGAFNAANGDPAAASELFTANPAAPWVDVEIKQNVIGTLGHPTNVITFSINKTTILSYVSTNVWNTGNAMLGYNDPFASIGEEDSAVFFSNLKVVQITPIAITSITAVPISGGTNVVIRFTTTDGDDTPASFTMLTVPGSGFLTNSPSGLITNIVQAVPGTNTFSQLGTGAFQWVGKLTNGSREFFQIKHN